MSPPFIKLMKVTITPLLSTEKQIQIISCQVQNNPSAKTFPKAQLQEMDDSSCPVSEQLRTIGDVTKISALIPNKAHE
jgi:hypothetical protein